MKKMKPIKVVVTVKADKATPAILDAIAKTLMLAGAEVWGVTEDFDVSWQKPDLHGLSVQFKNGKKTK